MNKKVSALPISRVLNAVSNRDLDFYDRLTSEELKELNLFTLIRYISNVAHEDWEVQAAFIERSNEFINKHYFTLQKNKKLMWRLYASIGIGIPVRYNYLKSPSKLKADKFEKLLLELYPTYKIEDVKLLASMMNSQDRDEIFDKMGFDKKQRKEYQ